jgi:hypothetical protein
MILLDEISLLMVSDQPLVVLLLTMFLELMKLILMVDEDYSIDK